MVGESLLEHLWSEAAIAARVRFQVFFFLSFKFQVNTRLSIVCTLKELQKLDNKHLYLNTVERSYRHIFRSSLWTATYSKQDWTGFQSRRLCNKQVHQNLMSAWCLLYKMVLLYISKADRRQKLQFHEAAHSCTQPENDKLCFPEKVTPEL